MRMTAVALPALFLGACGQPPEPVLDDVHWQRYQSQFLAPSGRVIDTGQEGISHSEGQAYAMLLAEAAADRAAFDRIWDWTRTHLGVREDGLLAWKWDPDAGAVADSNNATDADLLAAWGLLRAADRWRDDRYRIDADRILDALRSGLVVPGALGPVLLPGADGFVHDGVATINLSYWIFPALTRFGHHDPDGPWAALRTSGIALMDAARFGDRGLPADWVADGRPPRASPRFPARFGYEALRIPLYASWDGIERGAGLDSIASFWASEPHPPAWQALDDEARSPYGLGAGGMAVRRLLLDRRGLGDTAAASPDYGHPERGDYYDATLGLLAVVANHESRR